MEGSIKVQSDSRIKRLVEKKYSGVDELKATITEAFELNVPIQSITYRDTDGDDI